jgi:hypothetical protein
MKSSQINCQLRKVPKDRKIEIDAVECKVCVSKIDAELLGSHDNGIKRTITRSPSIQIW